MPDISFTKINRPNSYYSVKIRGTNSLILRSELDYWAVLAIFEQNLLGASSRSAKILAYCLEADHFCLLLYQANKNTLDNLIDKIINEYNSFYNSTYKNKQVPLNSDWSYEPVNPNQLLDLSMKIHCCPQGWLEYPYSSIRAYLYDDCPEWLDKSHVASRYSSAEKYLDSLKRYSLSSM